MEPALNLDAIAVLHSLDAGNVIPYKFAIALTENAMYNGAQLRICREVTDITEKGKLFEVNVRHQKPPVYVNAREKMGKSFDGSEPTSSSGVSLICKSGIAMPSLSVMVKGTMMALYDNINDNIRL